MAFRKRKRGRSFSPRRKRSRIVPGFTRSVGFYGRFNKAGRKGQEQKFLDTTLSFTVDNTAEVPATGGQVNLIPQGVTESQRIGRKAFVKSIQLRARMILDPAAAADSAVNVYMYLLLDKQANGGPATVANVFTNTDLSNGLLNLNNSGRFIILKKWIYDFNIGAGVTTAYNNVVKHIEFYKKCNIPIEFDSTTGAITEIRSNNVFLIAGSTGVGQDDTVTVSGQWRIRFTD